MNTERQGSDLLLSFVGLRRAIGALGICLPLVVMIGGYTSSGDAVRDSISAYYHSNMRDFFVGTLAMTGIFLLAYRGHDRLDRALTLGAGLFALGVAAFPTIRTERGTPAEIAQAGLERLGIFSLLGSTSRILHYACAVSLFLCLTGMCLQFTRHQGDPSPQKRQRNVVYRICAGVMVAAMLVAGAFFLFREQWHGPADWLLIVETTLLGAFGISWLVKSEAILSDEGPLLERIARAWRRSPALSP